jgi:tetratricopeptide (TPR) repeat protein
VAHGRGRDRKRRKQAGAETRAWFHYQDECVALAVLQHVQRGDLEGIEVETEPDLVIHFTSGRRLLVSIKHRGASQRGEVGWTWSELTEQKVLRRLHEAWVEADRDCSVSFYSDAGFKGDAQLLLDAAGDEDARDEVVRPVARQLGTDEREARRFLTALALPEDPLPRPPEVRDVALERVREILTAESRSGAHAAACYEALLQRIVRASRHRSKGGGPRVTVAPDRPADAGREPYISAGEVVDLLLRVHDQQAAPNVEEHRWQPDPHFVGRADELAALTDLLRPGSPEEVAPVVLRGMSGIGKTALAQQFAALHPGMLRPVYVNGSSRLDLIADLRQLDPAASARRSSTGPVAPTLPGSSATLLIIDGVASREVVQGLIPRRGLCRVLITSTVSQLDEGFCERVLDAWHPSESRAYVQSLQPQMPSDGAEALTEALHHHPLAIVQAVNLCARLGLGADAYLKQLASSPLVTLDTGFAAGHPDTVLKAIEMHLRAAEAEDLAARDLLAMLAFLDHGAGVPDRVFDAPPVAMELSGEDVIRPEDQRVDARTAALSDVVSDAARRRRTALVLTDLSLAEERDGTLAVHPLTSVILRAGLEDVTPWMEVGLGLFAKYLGNLKNAQPDDALLDVPIMSRLADTCLEHDIRGPGLYAALTFLAPQVASLLDVDKAIGYGELAYAWAERSAATPLTVMLARSGLAESLILGGELDRPLALYQANVDDAIAVGNLEFLVTALRDLSLAAVAASRHDLIADCERQLTELLEGRDPLEPWQRCAAVVSRAQLRLQTGDVAGAEADSQAAFALSYEEDVPPTMRAIAHQVAAALSGRDRSGSVSVEHHERLLDELRATPHGTQSRAYVHALVSAADADVTSDALERAAARLEEASQLRARWFKDDRHMETEIISVDGRLELHRALAGGEAHFELARTKLSSAVGRLRRAKGIYRRGLAAALINLAQVHAHADDLDGAIRLADEAYQLDVARYGAHHSEAELDKRVADGFRMAMGTRDALRFRMSHVADTLRRGFATRRPRTADERTRTELADAIEAGLAERARPRDHPDAGNLSRVPDVVELPPQRTLHPLLLGGTSGLALDLHLGDDAQALAAVLDALADVGIPRVRDLDGYLPEAPHGWHFVLWPTQVMIVARAKPGEEMQKLLFEEAPLPREWWQSFGNSGARMALLIGDVAVSDLDGLLTNMRAGRVAGAALTGMLV